MKNTIFISSDRIDRVETAESGSGIDLIFEDIVTADGVELYVGDNYEEKLTLDGNTATISNNHIKGSVLHFRLEDSGSFGQFYHIVYSKKYVQIFEKLNNVVVSNLSSQEV